MLKRIAVFGMFSYLMFWVGVRTYDFDTVFDAHYGAMFLGCFFALMVLGMYRIASFEGWLRVSPGWSAPRAGDVDQTTNRVWDGTGWRDRTERQSLPVAQQVLNRSMWAMIDNAGMSAGPVFNDRIRINREVDRIRAAQRAMEERALQASFRNQQLNSQAAQHSMGGAMGMLWNEDQLRRAILGDFPDTFPPRRPVVRRADEILNDRIRTREVQLKSFREHADLEERGIATLRRWMDGGATVQEIHAESNAELRQAMLEKFGLERYMAEVGAKVIASDQYGELLEYADVEEHDVTDMIRAGAIHTGSFTGLSVLRDWATDRITISNVRRRVRAVRVLNSTPDWPQEKRYKCPEVRVATHTDSALIGQADPMEFCTHRDYRKTSEREAVCNGCDADGHYRTYILRVPPNMRTPQEAIAWTFGLRAEEYAPARMT